MSEEPTDKAKTEAFDAIHDIAAILQLRDGLDPDIEKGFRANRRAVSLSTQCA
jgi:hypothetical protein